MQLLKSLFCFQGRDKAGRFALISLACYLVFLLFTLVLNQVPVLHLMFSLPLVAAISATAKRRVLDAAMTNYWVAAPIATFVLCTSIIALNPQGSGYFLLVLAIIVTLALMTRASAQNDHYILGYSGPVDLSMLVAAQPLATHYANRIEPTLVTGQENPHQPDDSQRQVVDSNRTHSNIGAGVQQGSKPWVESLQQWLQTNQTLAFGVATLCTCIALMLVISPWINATPSNETANQVAPATSVNTTTVKTRQHSLEMPNDYYLLMDENQGLLIHWPSYDDNDRQFWSVLTGLGEQSCQQLVFNDNQAVRTNLVAIENGGDYYASFSPLDTTLLINAIADKSQFSLCGFEFSLKGSRAAINSSAIYGQYLN